MANTGLLITPADKKDAAFQGLLKLGANLMAAGGYSRTPVSLGQAFGSGTQGYIEGYQGHLDGVKQDKFQGMQATSAQQQIDMRKQSMDTIKTQNELNEAKKKWNTNRGIDQSGKAYDFPMSADEITKSNISQWDRQDRLHDQKDLMKFGHDLKPASPTFEPVYNPFGLSGSGQRNSETGEIINYQKPSAPKDTRTSSQKDYEYAKRNGFKGSLFDYKERLAQAGGQRTQDPFEDALAKRFATQYIERSDRSTNALNTISSLDQLQGLQEMGIQTGFGQDWFNKARSFGMRVGIDVDTNKLAGEELFSAITKRMTGPLVKQLGANPTDRDLQFIVESAPRLVGTPEGNKLIMQSMRLASQRDIQISQLQEDYHQQNGSMRGFDGHLAQWTQQNPLFNDQQREMMVSMVRSSENSAPSYGGISSSAGQYETLNQIPGDAVQEQDGKFYVNRNGKRYMLRKVQPGLSDESALQGMGGSSFTR